jgi:hypothetical protein
VRDCFLIMFENIPSGLAAKDADIVRGLEDQRKERQKK